MLDDAGPRGPASSSNFNYRVVGEAEPHMSVGGAQLLALSCGAGNRR